MLKFYLAIGFMTMSMMVYMARTGTVCTQLGDLCGGKGEGTGFEGKGSNGLIV